MTSSPHTPAGSVEEFAEELRRLQVQAGSPTLAKLQHSTGISRTVLSAAFAGRQLPSARTVAGIVRACEGDTAEWLRRRDAIARGTALGSVVAPAAGAMSAHTPVQLELETGDGAGTVRRRTRRTLMLGALAGFVVGALLAGAASVAILDPHVAALDGRVATLQKQLAAAGPVNPHAQIVVRTGVDPAMTPCVNDAKVAASEDRTNNTRIQIVWSNKCYAGWARIARYDGKSEGNEVKVSIYPETAPNGPDRQDATEPGVQGAYTTLIVRPSPQTRLCAVGSITIAGTVISLGDPVCS